MELRVKTSYNKAKSIIIYDSSYQVGFLDYSIALMAKNAMMIDCLKKFDSNLFQNSRKL